MPPRKNQKRTNTQPPKASPMKRLRRAAVPKGKSNAREADKLEVFFSTYKSPTEESIGPEGIMSLCQDLGLDPADRKVLVLAWKLNAQRQGFFTWEEFQRGMIELGASDAQQLRRALDGLEHAVITSGMFQQLYFYSFRFCLMEPGQKIIDLETAAQMLSIVLAGNPHVPPFTLFLAEQRDYKTINMDQWTGFLRFTQEVRPDCGNYDESQAWPLLLDNYVEWRQKHP